MPRKSRSSAISGRNDLRADLDIPVDVRAWLTRKLSKDPARAADLEAIANKHGRLFPTDVWPVEGTVINTRMRQQHGALSSPVAAVLWIAADSRPWPCRQ